MHPYRVVAPLAVAAAVFGVAAVGQASAPTGADAQAVTSHGPVAQASGTDAVTLVYPSIVDTHVERGHAALERATEAVDQRNGTQAVVELNAAVWNMRRAWSGLRYVIRHTPATPPAEEGVDPVGPVAATPQDAATLLLDLQHDVATTSLGLIDTRPTTPLPKIRTTVANAIKARTAVVNFIHSLPVPPVADEGGVQAEASGDPLVATWDTVMQGTIPQLEDELQMINGPGTDPTDQTFRTQIRATRNTVNQFWPPVPPED